MDGWARGYNTKGWQLMGLHFDSDNQASLFGKFLMPYYLNYWNYQQLLKLFAIIV